MCHDNLANHLYKVGTAIGPRFDPWGTPVVILSLFETDLPTLQTWFIFLKYKVNKRRVVYLIPYIILSSLKVFHGQLCRKPFWDLEKLHHLKDLYPLSDDWKLLIRTIISVYKLIQAHAPNAQLIYAHVRQVYSRSLFFNTMSRNYTSYSLSVITRWSITIERYFGLFNKSINRILNWKTNAQSNTTPLLVKSFGSVITSNSFKYHR